LNLKPSSHQARYCYLAAASLVRAPAALLASTPPRQSARAPSLFEWLRLLPACVVQISRNLT